MTLFMVVWWNKTLTASMADNIYVILYYIAVKFYPDTQYRATFIYKLISVKSQL